MAEKAKAELDPAAGLYLEQYKAYLGDLGNIGSRYATVSGFYVSVISALLGILAFTETTKLFGQIQTATLLVVCGFAVCLCVVWSGIIRFYRALFEAKFTVLRQLEQHLPHECFREEYEILQKSGVMWLTRQERFVPLILILFFVALAVIRLRG